MSPKAEHQVVVCSSEWPQTIFSGQMSSSLDAKTSRTVETGTREYAGQTAKFQKA